MVRRLSELLVIDIESTCWDGPPPDNQEKEIIEIGVCVLDVTTGFPASKQGILVRPEHSEISPFCTDLTSLTPEQVGQGVPFSHACAILQRKYGSRYRVWASYGAYDKRQFERQCAAQDVPYPFGTEHINVKNLFAVMHGLPREVGMLTAMEMLGLPFEGVHHRGVDDAWNTALILSKLILQCRVPS